MSRRSLGTLTVDLIAKTGGFEQGMGRAERASERWRKQAEKDARSVDVAITRAAAAVAAGAVAAAGSVALMARQGIEAVDTQTKFARSLDTTYDSVTALRLAFGDSGIDGFESSLNRLNRRLGAAELGRGAALNAVKELSLDLQELARVDAAERVAIIADRIKEVATNSQTAARYAQDLGFEQREAAQFFLQGGEAIRAYNDQVERLGLSLSDADAAQIEAAANAMGVFGDLARATAQHFAVELSPAIQAAADAVGQFAEDGGIQKIAEGLHLVADLAAVAGIVIGSRLAGGAAASAVSFAAATVEAARYQAALARMAGVSATTAARLTALSASARAASAAMAVLGGPLGAALAVVGVLGYVATRNREAGTSFDELSASVDGARDSFDQLNRAQAAVQILDVQEALEDTERKAGIAAARMETYQRRLDMHPSSQKAEEWNEALTRAAGEFDRLSTKADQYRRDLEVLDGVMNRGSGEAGAEEQSDAFRKMEAQIRERIALIGQVGDAAKLRYQLEAGSLEGISEDEARALIPLYERYEAMDKANKQREQAVQSIARELTALERAAETWGMSAESVKLYDLALMGATETQLSHAQSQLQTVSGLQKAKEEQEAYLQLVQDLRTDEERLTDEFHARIAVLDAMAVSTRIAGDEYAAMAARAAEAAFRDAPEFFGLAPEIAGPWGELDKIGKAEEQLQNWYSKQLEMLDQFRSERADLSEQWDEQELAIHREHQERLQEIEQARHLAQLASTESLFGDLAGMAKTFAGEQSGIYKAMFAVQKAAAIAQAAVAIQQGIAMAAANPWPANLAAMASVAAATAGIVTNIAAIGMAHDGIDSVPQTGTWLLEKGERVVTSETSAKLDRKLDMIRPGGGGGGITIHAPVTVEAQPGMSAADAQRQGEAVSGAIRATIVSTLEKESRPGGLLWQLYGGGR